MALLYSWNRHQLLIREQILSKYGLLLVIYHHARSRDRQEESRDQEQEGAGQDTLDEPRRTGVIDHDKRMLQV
ncbi:hypothetical protein VTN00DRAFT_3962 [Thermoascus crustaceus]|uniref:uncharacterized protein n=1 Tax=Thermoascus crustaceus TaxID=5088 RepID=UPI0037420F0C